jgi:ABC-type dipeptide/oligopeptide/nickel transport system permease subunit
MSARSRTRFSISTAVLVLWLLIGIFAAFQRGYFGSADPNCSRLSTIAVTIVAGPLNYVGVNPTIECTVPQPSK